MIKTKAYYTDGREVNLEFRNEADMDWFFHMEGDHLLRYEILEDKGDEPEN